jgi:hypothetical protein
VYIKHKPSEYHGKQNRKNRRKEKEIDRKGMKAYK